MGDETISGYADPAIVWRLETLDERPFAGEATIRFPEQGIVTGSGPCNRFRAVQGAPYPWIEITWISATRRTCPALPAEREFLAALRQARLAEASKRVLILTTADGRDMVFRAE